MQKAKTINTTILRKEKFTYIFAIALLISFFVFFPEIDLTIQNPQQSTSLATAIEIDDSDEHISLDEIQDYAPIFIPTRWNASFNSSQVINPTAWNFEVSKEKYATQLETKEFAFNKNEINRENEAKYNLQIQKAFYSYARKDIPQKDKANIISYQIIDLRTGEIVKSQSIKKDISFTEMSVFKVSIGRDGWVLRPLVIQSTGNENLDDKLASLLTKSELLKQIPSGDYKVIFVP
jgi:hypothetical protein